MTKKKDAAHSRSEGRRTMGCLYITPSEGAKHLPKYRFQRIAESAPHFIRCERDYFLLYYTQNGYATVRGDGVDLRLGYGSIAILPPNTAHTLTMNSRGAEVTALAFTIGVIEEILQHQAGSGGTLSRIFNAGESVLIGPVPADTQIHLQHLVEFMLYEYRSERSNAEHAIRNCLATILCVFSELYREQLDAPEMREKNSIVYAIHYVKANYQKPLTIDDIARLVCMTRKELCQRFKKFSGTTFHSFLNRTRINAALAIMKSDETDLPLSELALLCGYDSYVTFYRNFIKHVGVPPTEYLALDAKENPPTAL